MAVGSACGFSAIVEPATAATRSAPARIRAEDKVAVYPTLGRHALVAAQFILADHGASPSERLKMRATIAGDYRSEV